MTEEKPYDIQTASHSWPKAGKGIRSTAVQCPHCGAKGAPGGLWTLAHVKHLPARCGRLITKKGIKVHEASCKLCIRLRVEERFKEQRE